MSDASKCKVGSLYFIRHKCQFDRTWTPAKRCRDSRGSLFWSALDAGCILDSAVTHIGPEILPPVEPRKPGIYRVSHDGYWCAGEWNGSDWYVAGSESHHPEYELEIGDYLGPLEPPSKDDSNE